MVSEIDDAVRWVRYRFDSPEHDDLDAMVQKRIERDPGFAMLLKRAIEERVNNVDPDDDGECDCACHEYDEDSDDDDR